MTHVRCYGKSPFRTAVIHGGPGAAGEMAPVARHLSVCGGILEPLQTAASVQGQIDELRTALQTHGQPPFTLIGFSWGAWLSLMVATENGALVKKLILVASGPFEKKYATTIQETRLNRLSARDRAAVERLRQQLSNPDIKDKNSAFARLGALFSKADSYDPLEPESESIDCRFDIFQKVWQQAAELRKNGTLLQLAQRITCPVLAIHGDYDPHPAAGVQQPLSVCAKDFRFILLNKCGHKPWLEKHARKKFYDILTEELL